MRSAIATIVVAVGFVVLAAGAFVYSGAYYVGADRPHWSITSWVLNEARDRSIRMHAAGIAVPAGLDDPARVVAGISHYDEHCAVCHGAPGAHPSDIAYGLYPRPPSLADAARSYSAAELFWIIKHGIRMTGMPAWGGHSDNELWATVAFIEKLPGMTEQNYAKLLAGSRAKGGHGDRAHEAPSGPAPQPAGTDHDHPPGHRH